MSELKEFPHVGHYMNPICINEKTFWMSGSKIPYVITDIDIEKVEFKFSLPDILNGGSGIIRDVTIPYLIDPASGEKLVESYDIRRHSMPVSEHIDRLYQSNNRWHTYGGISIGDLLMNSGYTLTSWDAERTGKSMVFYRLKAEEKMIREKSDYYGFLFSPCKIEPREVEFEIEDNGPRLKEGRPENAMYLLTGPPVIWNGKPISTTGKARWLGADLRHMLTFFSCVIGGRTMLPGERELRSRRELLIRALRGEAVSFLLDEEGKILSSEEIVRVRKAAEKSGYIEVDNPLKVRFAGDFCISGNKDLTIKY